VLTTTIDVEDVRPCTPAEAAAADAINPYLKNWYPLWVDAGFTADDITAWWPITAPLTMTPTWARRLRDTGQPPESVAAVLTHVTLLDTLTDNPAVVAVLASFAAEVQTSRASVAMDYRTDAITSLTAQGWTQPQIADHLGLTKQRVSIILKSQRRHTRRWR
jgi:hypothetical protein